MSINSPGVSPRVFDLLSPRSQRAIEKILINSLNNKLDFTLIKDEIKAIINRASSENDSLLIEECTNFMKVVQEKFQVSY